MHTAILLMTDHYDDDSIVDRYIHHFADHFNDLGYRVTLAYGRKGTLVEDSPVIREWCLPFLAEPERPQTPLELEQLARGVAELQPRLIVHHTACDAAVVETLHNVLPEVPLVWFAHPAGLAELWREHGPPGTRETGLPRLWSGFINALGGFHTVVTEGEAWARRLRNALPAASPPVITLPPSGTLFSRERPLVQPNCVLYSGPIEPERGLERLIEALTRIGHVGGRCLQVAGPLGDPAYLSRCESLALRAMERNDHFWVAFHPDPSPGRLSSLYEQATLLALPSGYPESPGPVPAELLQAMAHALPVVAEDIGAIGLMIRDGETGFLTMPGDVEDLAVNLAWLLTNPESARRMGQAAADFAQWSFGAREHITALNQVFEDLIFPVGGR